MALESETQSITTGGTARRFAPPVRRDVRATNQKGRRGNVMAYDPRFTKACQYLASLGEIEKDLKRYAKQVDSCMNNASTKFTPPEMKGVMAGAFKANDAIQKAATALHCGKCEAYRVIAEISAEKSGLKP